ncbi:MAG TPA: YfiR family protein [Rhodocyclaceae bacterium]|nr:YfiR family protein [Rhodocyclaceae bacterium]
MMRRLIFIFGIVQVLLLGAVPGIAAAQSASAVPEYAMKAAYLYNFSLLTSWPNQPSGAFNLCVFGQDDFGPTLDGLQGKVVDSQQMRVLHISRAEDAKQCQVVFIGDVEPKRVARLMAVIERSPVLTITDDKRLQNDAMIYLAAENQRLVFEVNADTSKRANLTFSSKLLRLAKRVVMQ